jgi:flagellar export protein FliJ
MNLTVLRTYAVQREEVAKLELADLYRTLQQTVERMGVLESRARRDADMYVSQILQGSTVTELYGRLDAMDQAIAARKGLELVHAEQQQRWAAKRDELVEAMQHRKKLDLLGARALRKQRRRQEQQDQQLLDERAWRRHPLKHETGS